MALKLVMEAEEPIADGEPAATHGLMSGSGTDDGEEAANISRRRGWVLEALGRLVQYGWLTCRFES